jgi:hypothetical protein
MTTPRDPDAMIAAWIDEGPHELPESTRRAIAVTTRTTHQRRRGFGSPWRPFLMTPFARTVTAVLLLAVGVAGAAFLLAPGSQVGGPPSTAVPSSAPPSESATVAPYPSELTVVDATQFAAPFQITWDVDIRAQVKADVVDIFQQRGAGEVLGGMNVFNVDQVGRDPCTTNELLEQPVQTAQEFMDWLATIPKTTAGPVFSSTSVGGYDALERTVSVGSLDGCIDSTNLHSGIVSQYAPGGYFMGAGEQERWIALEVNGRLIVFVIWPAGLPTVAEAAARALATVEFSS